MDRRGILGQLATLGPSQAAGLPCFHARNGTRRRGLFYRAVNAVFQTFTNVNSIIILLCYETPEFDALTALKRHFIPYLYIHGADRPDVARTGAKRLDISNRRRADSTGPVEFWTFRGAAILLWVESRVGIAPNSLSALSAIFLRFLRFCGSDRNKRTIPLGTILFCIG